MRTKKIVGGVVLIATLLISIVFITARPWAVPLTIRHVKVVQSIGGAEMTLEITNRTTSTYRLHSVWVEARDGSVWKPCSGSYFNPLSVLPPHSSQTSTHVMTNLPTGFPLRVRALAFKELVGLGTILSRLDGRFLKRQKYIPLNPFDKSMTVFPSKPTQVVSDEFVVPESQATSKANSEK